MRSYIFLICAAVLLISCNKKIVVDVVPDEKEIVAVQQEINAVTGREKTAENVIRLSEVNAYVNSPEGLRVRSSPGLDGNIINKLPDKEPVEVIKFSSETVEIDGINGLWTFVRSGEIEGWVFDGYLSDSVEKVEGQEFTGVYRCQSMTLIGQENMSSYELLEILPNTENIMYEIEHISDNTYLFHSNYSIWRLGKEKAETIEFKLPANENKPFYSMDAEKGGGGTHISFYFDEGKIKSIYHYLFYPYAYEEDIYPEKIGYKNELHFEMIMEKTF